MKQRIRGLGRGLDSLIPTREGDVMVPQMVAVDQIRPSHQQVRTRFDAEPLGELAQSIRRHGVLQPILVRRLADGYELIAGEVGSSRVDLQACKLEYSIVSPK